jgi:hypothetical protein
MFPPLLAALGFPPPPPQAVSPAMSSSIAAAAPNPCRLQFSITNSLLEK